MYLATAMVLLASTGQVQPPIFGCDVIVVGALTWGNCEDHVGHLYDVQAGPVVDGKPTMQVRYSTTWGTGVNYGAVSLLQKRGQHYSVLWTHRWVRVDNNGSDVERYAHVYHWRFERGGKNIVVTGAEKRGGVFDLSTGEGVARSIKRLPPEAFCYSSRLGKFRQCS